MNTTSTAARSVIVERELPHPAEKVWRALTQGPLLDEWLMKNDFKPIVGHKFNFRAQPNPHWNGVTDCQVLVVETKGFRTGPADDGFYQGAQYGWQKMLGTLEEVLARM